MINIKKGFTLIELLLVISIIIILFSMSKNLFQSPNKYIIDSEVCINKINGQITQFFYQGITGKDKHWNNMIISPTDYIIDLGLNKKETISNGESMIEFHMKGDDGHEYYNIDNNIHIDKNTSNIPSCNTKSYTVIPYNVDGKTNIMISKKLNNDGDIGMKICDQNGCESFTTKIDFLVCKKQNNIIDFAACKETFSIRFNKATQSIISNKCLTIGDGDNETCKNWSIDNF